MILHNKSHMKCRWIALFLILTVSILNAQTPYMSPFLDLKFGYNLTSNITYATGKVGYPKTTGTIDLKLDLWKPTGPNQPALLPGLVLIHGGGFKGGDKADSKYTKICQTYAKRGYVVISINYRLQGDNPSSEKGPFPNFLTLSRTMNAAVQDAASAVRWLRANAAIYRIDPTRIAIMGSSAGATTSLNEGYLESDIVGTNAHVRAIVDFWGSLSPNYSLMDANDPPVFIAHGTADTTVLISNSYDLVNQCNKVGLPYAFHPIAGAEHSCFDELYDPKYGVNGKTIDQLCADFLFEHLDLIALHPVAKTTLKDCYLDTSTGKMHLACDSDDNFLYEVQSSVDLQTWSTDGMPAAVPGNNAVLILSPPMTATPKQFYRVKVVTPF